MDLVEVRGPRDKIRSEYEHVEYGFMIPSSLKTDEKRYARW